MGWRVDRGMEGQDRCFSRAFLLAHFRFGRPVAVGGLIRSFVRGRPGRAGVMPTNMRCHGGGHMALWLAAVSQCCKSRVRIPATAPHGGGAQGAPL